ncbi:hypothetical protein [Aminiphilus sp.]|uniref:hypothetical protein n=1 Tax=Aminiphilus sp. TaxID=1872488 RepID=UPI0026383AF1|nr:hypothetical protein [Aminiphilus sp.]
MRTFLHHVAHTTHTRPPLAMTALSPPDAHDEKTSTHSPEQRKAIRFVAFREHHDRTGKRHRFQLGKKASVQRAFLLWQKKRKIFTMVFKKKILRST